MAQRLYAIERYDDLGAGAVHQPFPALPSPLRCTGRVYLPTDEVVIAFVEGADEASVAAIVSAAGWRVDRISPATWLSDEDPS